MVVFFLQKKRVDPNAVAKDGWTALQIAAYQGFYVIVDILLFDKRTLIDAVTVPERGTALHCACRAESLPVVQMLLLHKADLTILDEQQKTAKEIC